jgi:hypothetical protein
MGQDHKKCLVIEARKSTKSQQDELDAARKRYDESKQTLVVWSKMWLSISVPMIVEERERIIMTIGGWTAASMLRTGTTLKNCADTFFQRMDTGAASSVAGQVAAVESMQSSLAGMGETPFGMLDNISDPSVEASKNDNPFQSLSGDNQPAAAASAEGNDEAFVSSPKRQEDEGQAAETRDDIDELFEKAAPSPQVAKPLPFGHFNYGEINGGSNSPPPSSASPPPPPPAPPVAPSPPSGESPVDEQSNETPATEGEEQLSDVFL